tara:strand:+ start:564 stop:776 length:213 start_codon:yes stop_codon:yes gene_type:complete
VALLIGVVKDSKQELMVAIPIESDIVQLYKIDDKYQCPDYCGTNHIHKIHSDSKPLTFDKKSKIKIYLQK